MEFGAEGVECVGITGFTWCTIIANATWRLHATEGIERILGMPGS